MRKFPLSPACSRTSSARCRASSIECPRGATFRWSSAKRRQVAVPARTLGTPPGARRAGRERPNGRPLSPRPFPLVVGSTSYPPGRVALPERLHAPVRVPPARNRGQSRSPRRRGSRGFAFRRRSHVENDRLRRKVGYQFVDEVGVRSVGPSVRRVGFAHGVPRLSYRIAFCRHDRCSSGNLVGVVVDDRRDVDRVGISSP